MTNEKISGEIEERLIQNVFKVTKEKENRVGKNARYKRMCEKVISIMLFLNVLILFVMVFLCNSKL